MQKKTAACLASLMTLLMIGPHGLGCRGTGGQSTSVPRKPAPASSGPEVVGLAVGQRHACALLDSGVPVCWGANHHGQVGGGGEMVASARPVAGLADVTAITAGDEHTCALTRRGGVMCWGKSSARPVAVAGLGSGVAHIAAAGSRTCAALKKGGVLCWGFQWMPQKSGYASHASKKPEAVTGLEGIRVTSLAVGDKHLCALADKGGVHCFGVNHEGQLGIGKNERTLKTAQVQGLGAQVERIAAGADHSCVVTKGGALKCWGSNHHGQLATRSVAGQPIPVERYHKLPDDVFEPDVIDGLKGVVSVAAGKHFTCAGLRSGSVMCWGIALDGSSAGRVTRPRQVPGIAGVTLLAAGSTSACARTGARSVSCWEAVLGRRWEVVGLPPGAASPSSSSTPPAPRKVSGPFHCGYFKITHAWTDRAKQTVHFCRDTEEGGNQLCYRYDTVNGTHSSYKPTKKLLDGKASTAEKKDHRVILKGKRVTVCPRARSRLRRGRCKRIVLDWKPETAALSRSGKLLALVRDTEEVEEDDETKLDDSEEPAAESTFVPRLEVYSVTTGRQLSRFRPWGKDADGDEDADADEDDDADADADEDADADADEGPVCTQLEWLGEVLCLHQTGCVTPPDGGGAIAQILDYKTGKRLFAIGADARHGEIEVLGDGLDAFHIAGDRWAVLDAHGNPLIIQDVVTRAITRVQLDRLFPDRSWDQRQTMSAYARQLIPLGPGRFAVVLVYPQISVAVIDAAAGTIVRHAVLDCPKKQR